jgi:Pyridine nucleotide-disulphide oxidoreductase
MLLKSLGDSSNLFDPHSSFTIADHYAALRRPYVFETPIPVDIFIDYGCAFQLRFVPNIDERNVASITRTAEGFNILLDDGESVQTERVVIAVGIRAFTYVPELLAALPEEFVTHSADYGAVDALLGKKVAVLGSGASAIDLAAALYERGVDTSIISRRQNICFQSPPGAQKFHHKLLYPDTPIGGGWDLWLYANAPQLFHLLPERTRFWLVATTLGAAPGWFMTERVLGRIPIILGHRLEHAEIADGRVRLRLASLDGTRIDFIADRIVAATGFRIDTERLGFLSRGLKDEIATERGAPVLSGNFESSAKGLYFIGAATAPSFGPVMRFVVGAGYTMRRIAAALGGSTIGAKRSLPVLVKD